MDPYRIALANLRFPATPEESITLAEQAIDQASTKGARIVCFPECFVPGYRGIGKPVPPPDPEFLEHAWSVIAEAAVKATITVVLGTERFVDSALVAAVLVIDQDGSIRRAFRTRSRSTPPKRAPTHQALAAACFKPAP